MRIHKLKNFKKMLANLDPLIKYAHPESEIIIGDNKEVFIRKGMRVQSLKDLSRNQMKDVFSRSLFKLIEKYYHSDYLRDLIKEISHALPGIKIKSSSKNKSYNGYNGSLITPEKNSFRVAVFGNSPLGQSVHRYFTQAGFSNCAFYAVESFKSCLSKQFNKRKKDQVIFTFHNQAQRLSPASEGDLRHEILKEVDLETLINTLKDYQLAICTLEGQSYRGILDINRACLETGIPCIFSTVEPGEIIIGPTMIPSQTLCFECNRSSLYFGQVHNGSSEKNVLELLSTSSLQSDSPDSRRLYELVALEVFHEAQSFLPNASECFRFVKSVLTLPRNIQNRYKFTDIPAIPLKRCLYCHKGKGAASPQNRSRKFSTLANISLAKFDTSPKDYIREKVMQEDSYQSIGILGGGTAGYLTALGLRKKFPHLNVTLIESSKIPIIGVGEATTPLIRRFLHETLQFDKSEFYGKVQPTWKNGIKFFWGLPGDYYYNYPFGPGHLLEAYLYGKDINLFSFNSMTMSSDLTSVIKDSKSLFPWEQHAYHLDNKRFVAYLKNKANKRGIKYLDREITDVVLSQNKEEIDCLVASDGSKFTFDLYIDCSGFRSALLEKALGSKFVDYSKSLFTDTAIVANAPHNGVIKPYTSAQSMDHGWCWNIPMRNEDHLGYVFSSPFCTMEEAVGEMRAKHPEMGDYWSVKFRSGRHEHFWKGNVIGIGNSYGFVEPLESTAIHMIIKEIETLLEYFPSSKSEVKIKEVLNDKINAQWDYLRWFLAIHYKFNKKFDTPFWRESRKNVDVSGAYDLIELYKEYGPLFYRNDFHLIRSRLAFNDDLFGLGGFDTLLLGQGIIPNCFPKLFESYEVWHHRLKRSWTPLLREALPQKEALENIDTSFKNHLNGVKVGELIHD